MRGLQRGAGGRMQGRNWLLAMMLGMVITLGIRLAAIRWRLKLPTFEIEH